MRGEPIALQGAAKISCDMCHSCNGRHQDLECKPFHRALQPFTHFYLCPVTGDPVPMTILMCDDVQYQLHSKVMQDIFAAQGKPSMFATFRVADNGEVLCDAHSVEWPTSRLEGAAVAFANNLKARMPIADAAPLKVADFDLLRNLRQKSLQVATPVKSANGEQARAAASEVEDSDSDEEN